MGIEIQGFNGRPPAELTDRVTGKANAIDKGPARDNNAGPRLGSQDKVSLTAQAAQLQALEHQIADRPVVDTKRVAEVQQSFATGSQNIDATRVAEKMLEFESGLADER